MCVGTVEDAGLVGTSLYHLRRSVGVGVLLCIRRWDDGVGWGGLTFGVEGLPYLRRVGGAGVAGGRLGALGPIYALIQGREGEGLSWTRPGPFMPSCGRHWAGAPRPRPEPFMPLEGGAGVAPGRA